jgi:hypothetical protein
MIRARNFSKLQLVSGKQIGYAETDDERNQDRDEIEFAHGSALVGPSVEPMLDLALVFPAVEVAF